MGQIDVGTQEWLSSRRPIEGRYRSLQAYRAFDEISQKSFIDFKVTFVFGQVAPVVALCENPPNDCVQTQSMWDRLKDHISILRAIIMPTQCSQRKCVGGVVREIESALEGKILITRISKALAGGVHQAVEFRAYSWFGFELSDPGEVFEFLLAHARRSSSEPKINIFG